MVRDQKLQQAPGLVTILLIQKYKGNDCTGPNPGIQVSGTLLGAGWPEAALHLLPHRGLLLHLLPGHQGVQEKDGVNQAQGQENTQPFHL